jgi:hypothetical protein
VLFKDFNILNRLTMTQFGKFRAAAGFLLVFLLIFGTNRLDKHHFETIQNKITSVYEDHIMAQYYIYQINAVVHNQVHLIRYEASTNSVEFAKADSLLAAFGNSKLTKEETRLFDRLQGQLNTLANVSASLVPETDSVRLSDQRLLKAEQQIHGSLDRLSSIQREQGWDLKKAAQATLDRNTFISQAELLALAIIAILIQLIIFYKPTKD